MRGITAKILGLAEEDELVWKKGQRDQVTRMVENKHLAHRAAAAYFAEKANDLTKLTEDAIFEQSEDSINSVDHLTDESSVYLEGSLNAKVDRDRKLPVVTLFASYLTQGGEPRSDNTFVAAKYRYNPQSDKLQRIG